MKTTPRVNVGPPLPLRVYTRRPARKLPFPLEEPQCYVFSRARHGLFVGVKALGLGSGTEVLVPAYHHGSEVEALVQAGITCQFYDLGRSLEPDEQELEALLNPRVRALHLTHYLGLPQDAARWRNWCDERGLMLIEDAAQAWLSAHDGVPVGSHGDLSLFCLYKTFGLPDGGAVLSSVPLQQPARKLGPAVGRVVREHGLYLAQQYGWFAEIHRRLRRTRDYDPEQDFALGTPMLASSTTTRLLLARVASQQAQKIRAANYKFLLERLERFVPEPFRVFHEDASPYAFPIRSEDKKEALGKLDQHGVAAANFWSVPHPSLLPARFPRATALRESVITLPVHQELDVPELERIVDAVLAAAT